MTEEKEKRNAGCFRGNKQKGLVEGMSCPASTAGTEFIIT
jgi:hypothetical protein